MRVALSTSSCGCSCGCLQMPADAREVHDVFFVVRSSLTAVRIRATLAKMRREGESVAVTSFGEHAEESLHFIRRTMERSSTFTAVPGLGGAGMGAIGLAAAVLAANQRSAE